MLALLNAWSLRPDEWPTVARVAFHLGRTSCPECRAGTPCAAWLEPALERLRWLRIDEAVQAHQHALDAAVRARDAQRHRWREPPPRARQSAPQTHPRLDVRESAARVLGLSWPCDAPAVQTAFRRAALRAHPDVGGNDAAMRAVIAARAVLLR